ncbi:perilipin-2-like isoform X3 [Heterodontus francisci]|uniref:perilipin-2-like isoform X3 n=1 Tax=Heterodontus francisci TaxID=7792 RepID=UPI00355B7468
MSGDGQNSYIRSKESFIKRFSSLLAVSSTYDIFYNVYKNTKDKYPVVASVWEVSEGGIKRTTALVLKSMQPVLRKLQPQIAVANDYACKGLDHLEEKFPVLHEDATKIASDMKEMAVTKMKSIRDKVTSPILHVSDKAINVVTCRIEKTKVLIDESVTSVLTSGIGRLITDGVDAALLRSEQLVDSYLPNEDGNGTVDEDLPSEETINPSIPPQRNYKQVYFLASKLYSHAYKHIVMSIQNAKKQKQEIVAFVPDVFFVRTLAKEKLNIASSNLKMQDLINRWVLSWHTNNMEGEQKEGGIMEPAVPGLHKNFQTIFSDIAANLNEVSNVVQMKKQQTFKTVQKVYSQLWSMNLPISLGHFASQLKGKLWDSWKALYVRKDGILSDLANILLLSGISTKEDETEKNQSQGWNAVKPRPAKEEEMAQISEGIPESQMTQGREVTHEFAAG